MFDFFHFFNFQPVLEPLFLSEIWPCRLFEPFGVIKGDRPHCGITETQDMHVRSSFAETLAFDDASLASQLFGPLNAHVELIADASGASLRTRGTELTVSDPRPEQRELLMNLFTQSYGLLRSGHTLRGEDLLHHQHSTYH